MGFLKSVIGSLLVLGIGAILWLYYQNRGSEQLNTTFWPAVFLSVVAVLVTVLFTLKEEKIKERFLAVYYYDINNKATVDYARKQFRASWYAQEAVATDATLIGHNSSDNQDHETIKKGGQLYFDIAIASVWASLAECFSNSWDSEMIYFETPSGLYGTGTVNLKAEPGTLIKLERFSRLFPENAILRKARLLSGQEKFYFPPKTHISGGTTGTDLDGYRNMAQITLQNPFVQIQVDISNDGGGLGLGSLDKLLKMEQGEGWRYWHSNYSISLNAQFARFRMGHPNMPIYRKWTQNLFKTLKRELDIEQQWNYAKEYSQLYGSLPLQSEPIHLFPEPKKGHN